MKHLIIYAHPNKESLNHLFKQTVEEYLKEQNHEVIVRDLYQIRFNPVLSLTDINGQHTGIHCQDVKEEQQHITWADVITFVYPIWWTGMPSIMKGYIDRVFSYGFAYRYDQGIQKGLLTGKSVYIINSQGKSKSEYKAIGMNKALKLTSDKGIFLYCGLTIKKHFFFDQADRATAKIIEEWIAEITESYMNEFPAAQNKTGKI